MLALIFFTLALANTASAFTHGITGADVTCNLVTGVATGVGAGTCVASPPTCDGVTDNTSAFDAFATWAKGTWQASHTGTVGLLLPLGSNCQLNAPGTVTFAGIKNLLVIGYGAQLGGNYFHLGGKGQFEDFSHSARTQTVSAGASFVTLATPAQTSLYTVNQWAVQTGFDLQSVGFPTNQFYFDYVLVTAKDGACQGTGTVCFASPLKNAYKSTWPNYPGNVSIDAGGPATLYALPPEWDTQVEWRGVKFTTANPMDADGRQATFRDVSFTGSSCIFPSQNLTYTVIHASMAGCTMEVDKLIDTLTITGTTINAINFQSTGVNYFNLDTSNVTLLLGSGRKNAISNTTMATFLPGPSFFGRTDEVVCTNCVVNSFTSGGGLPGSRLYKGTNDAGLNNMATMSGGVIRIPNGSTVTGFANNGSGLVRLTMTTTAGLTTGLWLGADGIFQPGGVSNDGAYQVTLIDGTHVDLIGSTFAGSTWSGAGRLGNRAPLWAVPGTNEFWSDGTNFWIEGPAWQVLDVTQDATYTNIQTSLPGGFPVPPNGGTKNFVYVHPAPKFTCVNCSGADPNMASLNNAPAGAPLWSYQTRVDTGARGTTAQPPLGLFGNLSQISINVSPVNLYAGAGALTYSISQNWPVIKSDNTNVFYNAIVNAKTGGTRLITLSTVTNPQVGDTGLAAPDSAQTAFTGVPATSGAIFSANVSASCPACSSISTIMQTDQGVVYPPQLPYLLKRDLDPASNDNTPMWMDKAA